MAAWAGVSVGVGSGVGVDVGAGVGVKVGLGVGVAVGAVVGVLSGGWHADRRTMISDVATKRFANPRSSELIA